MRKSLWIIPVLFATIVIPYANADSIPDPTTITNLGLTSETMLPPLADVITKFECCNGAKVAIHDLEITFNAPITGFGHNLGNDCKTKGVGTGTVAVTCTNAIPVGDIVVTSETSTGKFALACWTDVKGACQANATPTPEPASMDLVGIGIWIVVVLMRKRLCPRSPIGPLEFKSGGSVEGGLHAGRSAADRY